MAARASRSSLWWAPRSVQRSVRNADANALFQVIAGTIGLLVIVAAFAVVKVTQRNRARKAASKASTATGTALSAFSKGCAELCAQCTPQARTLPPTSMATTVRRSLRGARARNSREARATGEKDEFPSISVKSLENSVASDAEDGESRERPPPARRCGSPATQNHRTTSPYLSRSMGPTTRKTCVSRARAQRRADRPRAD